MPTPYNPEQDNSLPPIDGTHPGDFGPGIPQPPPGGGTTPTTANPPNNFNLGDFLSSLVGGGGNGNLFGIGGDLAQRGLFLGQAYEDWKNAGKYSDLAKGDKFYNQAKENQGVLDPFGGQRGYYQDRLRQMYEDPTAYLENSPDFRAARDMGIGALDRSAAAGGNFGVGKGNADLMRFGSQLGAQYLDQERKSLMNLAGAQFGPETYGNMLGHGMTADANLMTTGIKGEIDQRNNALTNLARGLFPNTKTGGGGAGGGGGLTGAAKSVWDSIKGQNYEGMVKSLMSKFGMSAGEAQQFIREGQAGDDSSVGNDMYDPPAQPGGGLVDTGDGWYDPDTGRYMDYEGNLIGNVGGPGEPGDATTDMGLTGGSDGGDLGDFFDL